MTESWMELPEKASLTWQRDKGIDVVVRKISVNELIDAHSSGTLKEMFGAGTACRYFADLWIWL